MDYIDKLLGKLPPNTYTYIDNKRGKWMAYAPIDGDSVYEEGGSEDDAKERLQEKLYASHTI